MQQNPKLERNVSEKRKKKKKRKKKREEIPRITGQTSEKPFSVSASIPASIIKPVASGWRSEK